jgi:urea transport system substrate-binding protein
LTAHPSSEQLNQFSMGLLADTDAATVRDHVGQCETCWQALKSLWADKYLEGLLSPSAVKVGAKPSESSSHPTVNIPIDATGAHLAPSSVTMAQAVAPHKAPSAPPTLPPALLHHPRYKILEMLGAGGMGVVYKATDEFMQRPVALKVIGGGKPADQEAIDRFQREVQMQAQLSHPNIVAAYDTGQLGDSYFLVMEYVEGINLWQLVRQHGPLSVPDACELIRQAAVGMQHAHERGLVHRDLKPSNLLLTKTGQVKILDLGLARPQVRPGAVAGEGDLVRQLTGQNQFLGSVDYTAPEQWENSSLVDIRADVYSLGCTLFHLLTGRTLYDDEASESVFNRMVAHATKPVPSIKQFRSDVPATLPTVLERMLAKDRVARYASPSQVADALERLTPGHDLQALWERSQGTGSENITGRQSTKRPAPGPTVTVKEPGNTLKRTPPTTSFSRRGLLYLAVGAVALLLAGFGAWWHWGGEGPSKADNANPNFTPPVPSGPPIKVGILHSFSGTMATSEKPVAQAVQLALEEINASGGLLGRPIEAVEADGGSDEQRFASRAEQLIAQEKVAVIFGCWTSASRKAVKPVMERHAHLLFYPVQYEGIEQSPNIIYLGSAPNQQLLPAVKWVRGEIKGRRYFLVGSDYVFPRMANAILKDEIKALGGEIVGEEYLLLGSPDVGGIIKKIAEAKPDVIFNTINGDSNVAFFRQLRQAGIRPAQTPTVSFSIAEQELSVLGAQDMAGDYAVWNYFQSIDRPENHIFVRKFKAKYGSQAVVSDPMEAAYVGVHLWAKAVAAAKSTDVAAVRLALRDQRLDAPSGHVRLDPGNQHLWKVARFGRIQEDGQFEILSSTERPVPPQPYPPSRKREEWEAMLQEMYKRWGNRWANPGN